MRTFSAVALSVLLVCSAAYAQQPTPKVTTLMKSPVSGQPDKEFVFLSIEWPSGASTPPHTHLGDEYGTVVEGSYMVKQGDSEAKTYNAGQSWHVPAGVVHETKNAAPITKTMNAFIVEKDKPLIQPLRRP